MHRMLLRKHCLRFQSSLCGKIDPQGGQLSRRYVLQNSLVELEVSSPVIFHCGTRRKKREHSLSAGIGMPASIARFTVLRQAWLLNSLQQRTDLIRGLSDSYRVHGFHNVIQKYRADNTTTAPHQSYATIV